MSTVSDQNLEVWKYIPLNCNFCLLLQGHGNYSYTFHNLQLQEDRSHTYKFVVILIAIICVFAWGLHLKAQAID